MLKLFKKNNSDLSGSLSSLALKKFIRNRLAFVSLLFIAFSLFVCVFGYLISPDSTPYANQQILEIIGKKPGFSINELLVKKNSNFERLSIFRKIIWGESSNYKVIPLSSYKFENNYIIAETYNEESDITLKEYQKFPLTDVVYGINNKMKYSDSELKNKIFNNNIVKKTFILGTDRFGRDVLSQLIIGTRVSLSVGFISVIISLIVGIFFGSLAGFYKGWVDNLIMWLINVVWSIPSLLLIIAITFALGKGFWQVFIAVGLTMWVEVARVVRGQVLSIREKEFVEAARALGFRNTRIIFRHILPNVMGSVIVISAANFATAILVESGLSFLGLGVQPPVPSWGTMIREHYSYIILGNAWLPMIPGIAIMLMVLAFMIVGNGLRDALDVKLVQKT